MKSAEYDEIKCILCDIATYAEWMHDKLEDETWAEAKECQRFIQVLRATIADRIYRELYEIHSFVSALRGESTPFLSTAGIPATSVVTSGPQSDFLPPGEFVGAFDNDRLLEPEQIMDALYSSPFPQSVPVHVTVTCDCRGVSREQALPNEEVQVGIANDIGQALNEGLAAIWETMMRGASDSAENFMSSVDIGARFQRLAKIFKVR